MTADLQIIVNGFEVLAGIGAVWSLINNGHILFAASPKPQTPQGAGTKAKKTPPADDAPASEDERPISILEKAS